MSAIVWLVPAGDQPLPLHWRQAAQQVATIEWHALVETEALSFVVANLLAPRFASERSLQLLHRPFRGIDAVLGLSWSQRAAFLADRPAFPPEPPQALAETVDLEDLVADFGKALAAWRLAAEPCDWLLIRST